MKKYLLLLTFYAGTKAEEDTDRASYIVAIEEEKNPDISFDSAKALITKLANDADTGLYENKDEDDEDAAALEKEIGFNYEIGLNNDTLVKAMNILGKKQGIALIPHGKIDADCEGPLNGVFSLEVMA